MSQYLPYDEIKFVNIVKLEDISNISDDKEVGYFVGVDLKYPDGIKQKTKNFPFCPENKFSPQDTFTKYMKKMKQDSYAKCKKLVCDWTDTKKYLIHYRMLKFYVRHGMIVEKVLEVIFLGRVSGWRGTSISILRKGRKQKTISRIRFLQTIE